jgi:ribonucleoside-diphosphate reductase alpha chain
MSNLCVAGDTIIETNNGKKMIKDTVIGELVKSFNIHTNEVEFKEITNFALTNPKAKVMKITDVKTGQFIKCTPEHKVWTENRGYVEARFLQEDDILNLK